MAKKRRSAKQKANDRRLGQMAKARARRQRPASIGRKPRKRKVNKPRKRSKPMAKKRGRVARTKQKIINKIPILKNPAVKEVAMGLGMARIVSTVARRVPIPAIQNNAALLGTGAAFATDIKAGIVDLALGGGLGALSGIFGGNGGNGGMTNASNGFA